MPNKTSLTVTLATLVLSVSMLHAQRSYPYEHEQAWPANQTISDLKAISAHNTFSPREGERYDNAMTHLSQFAEKLHQGRFDRGKLERGIDDVQGLLNHNPMDGRARDILNHDLGELRRLKATYKIGY